MPSTPRAGWLVCNCSPWPHFGEMHHGCSGTWRPRAPSHSGYVLWRSTVGSRRVRFPNLAGDRRVKWPSSSQRLRPINSSEPSSSLELRCILAIPISDSHRAVRTVGAHRSMPPRSVRSSAHEFRSRRVRKRGKPQVGTSRGASTMTAVPVTAVTLPRV
jgi:hypothetical protein